MNVNLIERSDAEDNPSRVLFNTPTSSRGSIASPEVSNARVSVAVKGMDFNTSSDIIFRNSLLGNILQTMLQSSHHVARIKSIGKC